jgi:hypothetical protein
MYCGVFRWDREAVSECVPAAIGNAGSERFQYGATRSEAEDQRRFVGRPGSRRAQFDFWNLWWGSHETDYSTLFCRLIVWILVKYESVYLWRRLLAGPCQRKHIVRVQRRSCWDHDVQVCGTECRVYLPVQKSGETIWCYLYYSMNLQSLWFS